MNNFLALIFAWKNKIIINNLLYLILENVFKIVYIYITFIFFQKNLLNKEELLLFPSGSGSSDSITTGCGLEGPGIESRWGARFSAPVQTGPGAHSASCTMGTGSLPGVKSGRVVKLTPNPI